MSLPFCLPPQINFPGTQIFTMSCKFFLIVHLTWGFHASWMLHSRCSCLFPYLGVKRLGALDLWPVNPPLSVSQTFTFSRSWTDCHVNSSYFSDCFSDQTQSFLVFKCLWFPRAFFILISAHFLFLKWLHKPGLYCPVLDLSVLPCCVAFWASYSGYIKEVDGDSFCEV